MQTLTSYYQEIKDKLKTQLEAVETTEQTVTILQDEINKLADLNSDYIRSLTPSQARIAIVMLKELNQYTSILRLIKLQDSDDNPIEKSHSNNTLSPLKKVSQIEKNLQSLTSPNYYQQVLLQPVERNRDVIGSLLAGFMTGTFAGGYTWGFIGAITGGVIGKIFQPKKLVENTDFASLPEDRKNQVKIGVDIDRLLNYLYQALQSIDITVAAYGAREEKAPLPGLENNLDLLEYLQDLMADALNQDTQLPTAVRRRIEQAATILRHYGIQAQVYQPGEKQNSEIEADLMFYFEPSLDPQVTDYVTLKHAFVKDDQVLLPGYVIEPALF